MRCSRTLAGLALASLIVAACADGGATLTMPSTTTTLPAITSTTPATTSAPATTSSTPTTTIPLTTTSTTASTTTTTTTLPPAVPVVGWEGEGIRDLDVALAFDRPVAALDMEAMVDRALRAIGIRVDDDADAVLVFTLEGIPLSANYGSAGRCYTGARVTGTAFLTAPERPGLDTRFSGEVPTPMVTFGCETDEDYAPLADAFEKGLLAVIADLWGPAATPFLIEVVEREITDSALDLALKSTAMDEFRGLDAGSIPLEQRTAFLEAVIDTVEYLVETDYTPHGADEAARRVLTVYAGTNYGVATADDVGEWRAWLEDWVAGGGS